MRVLFVGFLISLCITLVPRQVLADDFRDGVRAYQKKDFSRALALWLPLAEQGNVLVQTLIGTMYAYGEGTEQDDKEAVKWFTHAARQGSAQAQYNLGIMYEQGFGVEKDLNEARRWLLAAAEQGREEARKRLDTLPSSPVDNAMAKPDVTPGSTIKHDTHSPSGSVTTTGNTIPGAVNPPAPAVTTTGKEPVPVTEKVEEATHVFVQELPAVSTENPGLAPAGEAQATLPDRVVVSAENSAPDFDPVPTIESEETEFSLPDWIVISTENSLPGLDPEPTIESEETEFSLPDWIVISTENSYPDLDTAPGE